MQCPMPAPIPVCVDPHDPPCDFMRLLYSPGAVQYSPKTKLRTYTPQQLGAILEQACPNGVCPLLGNGFQYNDIQQFITPTG